MLHTGTLPTFTPPKATAAAGDDDDDDDDDDRDKCKNKLSSLTHDVTSQITRLKLQNRFWDLNSDNASDKDAQNFIPAHTTVQNLVLSWLRLQKLYKNIPC